MRIENIRGFDNCVIVVGGSNAVLVGPNNAGKTSLLRILDWLVNSADDALLQGKRALTPAERDLLVPARQTGGRARRITLQLRFRDGRTARRFGGDSRVAQLRLGLKSGGITATCGPPKRGETASTPLGRDLLALLQSTYSVEYVPPHRSASADDFRSLVRSDLLDRACAALLQSPVGGRPTKDQRALQQAINNAAAVTARQLDAFWEDLRKLIPESLGATGAFDIPLERADLLEYLVGRAAERVATGEHDSSGVRVRELGSGHQSLLWLALKLKDKPNGSRRLLLIEEPESFLHPSAQRQVARQLFDSSERQILMTTHSTVLVDEADAKDLRLVRDHKIFSLAADDERRSQINSALLTGRGSEVIFSSAILLVEGPGDRLFFERLRRRLAGQVMPQVLGAMTVIDVGGKTQFGPWVQLLEGFLNRTTGERPIRWLLASDSGDAVAATIRGLNDAGISIPADVRSAAQSIPQNTTDGYLTDADSVATQTLAVNDAARSAQFGLQFVPVDLEYAALTDAKAATVAQLAAEVGISAGSAKELMTALGSKGGGSKPGSKKAPWIRERVAAILPWAEVSIGIKDILWQWASLATSQLGLSPIPRPPELRMPQRRKPVPPSVPQDPS